MDERMAQVARLSGIEVEVAAFEGWDPTGRTFDTVISAQTWHWIDPVAGAAKARAALRPGGALVLFWNTQLPGADVREAFSGVHRRVLPEAVPDFWVKPDVEPYQPFLEAAAEGLGEAGGFAEPKWTREDWEHRYERDAWLEQLPTSGLSSRIPGELMSRLIEETGAAIDRLGGSFVMPYATMSLTTTTT